MNLQNKNILQNTVIALAILLTTTCFSQGKKARIKNVVLSNYEFENVIVSYPDSVFFKKISIYSDRNGSLGGEVIKRFNWVLDYANSDFYFEKNDKKSLRKRLKSILLHQI